MDIKDLASTRVKDILTVQDFQAELSNEDSYEVQANDKFKAQDFELFHFIEAGLGEEAAIFIVEEDQQRIRIYYLASSFSDREDALANGGDWIFKDTIAGQDASELEFAEIPNLPAIEEMGEEKFLHYSIAGKALYCERLKSASAQFKEDVQSIPCILLEYYCSEETLNPFMMILEEAWLDVEGSAFAEGGSLSVFLGCEISINDISLYAAKAKSKKSWFR